MKIANKFVRVIISIITLIQYAQLTKVYKEVILCNENKTFYLKESSYFHIKVGKIFPEKAKIIIKGNKKNNSFNNIASYYQNSNSKERKKINKNESGDAELYLNKIQTNSDFYLSIECTEIPCNYTVDIITEEHHKSKINIYRKLIQIENENENNSEKNEDEILKEENEKQDETEKDSEKEEGEAQKKEEEKEQKKDEEKQEEVKEEKQE